MDGPCVMCIFRGSVPYFHGASLVIVLLGLEGSSLKQLDRGLIAPSKDMENG